VHKIKCAWLGYGLDGPGFQSWAGQKSFIVSKMSRPAVGPTQPPVPCSFPNSKWPGRVVEHFPPSGTEVANE